MKAISKQRLIDAAPIVALLVVALILPFVLEPFWVEHITGWIPIAIGALGLNLLTGYNGQISAPCTAWAPTPQASWSPTVVGRWCCR